MRPSSRGLIVAFTIATAACTSTDNSIILENIAPDDPHAHATFPANYTFESWVAARHGNLPDPVIIMSFSGGFMHAAALANEVLHALGRYDVIVCDQAIGRDRHCRADSLLNHIIAISSTSGGGFANVNFVLHGRSGLDTFDGVDDQGQNLAKGFLQKNLLVSALEELGVRPWRLTTTLGPFAARSPLMESLLNDSFPRTPTGGLDRRRKYIFSDLSPDRPFAIFGATDYAAERHFIFSQDSFTDVCSDLSRYPLMNAVTASGAFPLLLTDVELRNHWADECALSPNQFDPASQDAYTNETDYLDHRYSYDLQHSGTQPGDPPLRPETYVHLFDGGISDNLAIRPLMRYVLSLKNLKTIFDHKTILYVQVNARSDPPSRDAKTSGSPNLVGMALGVPYASIDADTTLSNQAAIMFIHDRLDQALADGGGMPAAIYFAQVDFDQYPALPLYSPQIRRENQDRLKSLGGLSISQDDVRFVRQAAFDLLSYHRCFQRFLSDPRFEFDLDGHAVARGDSSDGCLPDSQLPQLYGRPR